jgi:hypothetical protein
LQARLLHYFAPTPVPDVSEVEEKEVTDDLCGIHLDHSLLTGLCTSSTTLTSRLFIP